MIEDIRRNWHRMPVRDQQHAATFLLQVKDLQTVEQNNFQDSLPIEKLKSDPEKVLNLNKSDGLINVKKPASSYSKKMCVKEVFKSSKFKTKKIVEREESKPQESPHWLLKSQRHII